jgi:hypothetical protein
MTAAGVDVLVAYGNGWQGDYLMYVSDFPILEGHGLAVLTPDGACRLYLDSASEIDRATAETAGIEVRFSQQIGRDVAADLKARGNVRVSAAPLAFVPFALIENAPGPIGDATSIVDACLMHKTPAEVDRVRKAAQTADDAYVIFRQAAQEGRKQYEVVAETESWLRANGVADNFMLIGSGGTDIRSVRRRRTGASPKATTSSPNSRRRSKATSRRSAARSSSAKPATRRSARTTSISKRSRRASPPSSRVRWPPTSRARRTTSSANTTWANT